jgi:hypothetical protein
MHPSNISEIKKEIDARMFESVDKIMSKSEGKSMGLLFSEFYQAGAVMALEVILEKVNNDKNSTPDSF